MSYPRNESLTISCSFLVLLNDLVIKVLTLKGISSQSSHRLYFYGRLIIFYSNAKYSTSILKVIIDDHMVCIKRILDAIQLSKHVLVSPLVNSGHQSLQLSGFLLMKWPELKGSCDSVTAHVFLVLPLQNSISFKISPCRVCTEKSTSRCFSVSAAVATL